MSDWAPKRFWKSTAVVPAEGGATVHLDARPIRTPAGAALVLPTEDLARAVAEEWDAQVEHVDPSTMPMTRTANSAIDKVAPQKAAVIAMLAEYGATDLLCYRADTPRGLVARQTEEWDPLIEWAAERHGARLTVTQGVMPIPQTPEALDRLAGPMEGMSPFQLAAFHDLVALSGSLVLALATVAGFRSPSDAWEQSRLDEEWQAGAWGRDEEADRVAALKRTAFLDAHRFFSLCDRAAP